MLLISEALTVPLDELSWVGMLLAATAGACWAAYILLSGRTGAAFARLDGLAIALVFSTLVVLPVGILQGFDPTPEHLLKGLGLAVLSSLLPYSLELLALRRLSASVFGILLSLEPAVAALAGLPLPRPAPAPAPARRDRPGRARQRPGDGAGRPGPLRRGARPPRVRLTAATVAESRRNVRDHIALLGVPHLT